MKTWYAVYTKPKCEKKVSASLTKKKIENYCPLNKSLKTDDHSDRTSMVLEPLFPNFVFVRIEESEMSSIRNNNEIINFVYWLGRPVVIKDIEIENIQDFVSNYSNIILEKIPVSMNKMVRIVNQLPFKDEFDNYVFNNKQIRITLPTLGYIMCAQSGEVVETINDSSEKAHQLVS